MLALTAWALGVDPRSPATAATNAGAAQVVAKGATGAAAPLDHGGSATAFSLQLPDGASCTGDSANNGYRVQSFMIPATVDPASLQFGASGPSPAGVGASFRQALYTTTSGSPYVNIQTAAADHPPGPGRIVNIPDFDFKVFLPGDIGAGTYSVGIACTLGPPSATQVDAFWTVALNVAADTSDTPAGITWSVPAPPPTTTSSSSTVVPLPTTSTSTTTTSTTVGATTTVTVPATTTTARVTTTALAATTTTASSTTTSTFNTSSSPTTVDPPQAASTAADPPGSGDATVSPASIGAGGASVGELARTGVVVVWLCFWAAVLLYCGVIAVRLGSEPIEPGGPWR